MNNFFMNYAAVVTEEDRDLASRVTPVMDELICDEKNEFSELFEVDPVAAFRKLYPLLRRSFSIKKKQAIAAYLMQCMVVTGRWEEDRNVFLPDAEDVACALAYIRKEGKKMKAWCLHVVNADAPGFDPDNDCTYDVQNVRIYNK